MDKRYLLERNLLALSQQNPGLYSRLSVAKTTLGRYRFLGTPSGELMPALVDCSGKAHALHSTINPKRETDRLLASIKEKTSTAAGRFMVFLGLGAGYSPIAALNSGDASHVLIIDYDINGIAELLCSREYASLLGDPRCTFLVDPLPDFIVEKILELYCPALYGGIKVLPLRPRVESDKQNFDAATDAIQQTIDKLSRDYSVQAHFGMRWFSNIIRNLGSVQCQNGTVAPIHEAAICAAGPSLDEQITILHGQKALQGKKLFLIAADTALPALLKQNVIPDAVVSIDCQHISYYHFLGTDCSEIPLFLDIASPPMLSQFSTFPFFFSGGHPLAAYISQQWKPLPILDISGGNVAYACLSLAESLGARKITVYGADFSYPFGRVYAKGTYIYPYFERRQSRFCPFESHLSSFLYRSPFLPTETEDSKYIYETTALRFYRKSFEQKASIMEAEVSLIKGFGIPIVIDRNCSGSINKGMSSGTLGIFAPKKAAMSASKFLEQYKKDIETLPVIDNVQLHNLSLDQRRVFTTLLPQMAAVRHRRQELPTPELIGAVKQYCIQEIEKVLNSGLVL